MEIGYKYYKGVILFFGVVIGFISCLYSCSTQRSLAGNTLYIPLQDTMVVPKQWRPSTLAQQQPTKPLKLPTEEQLQFNKKLNYVLDNAGTSFDNIGLIRGDISDLRELIENRAISLRNDNDSLSGLISRLNAKQEIAYKFAEKAELARIRDAESTRKDREQNEAYRDAFTVYSTIGITVFVLLLIGVIVLTVLVYRQKNYLRTHFSHV